MYINNNKLWRKLSNTSVKIQYVGSAYTADNNDLFKNALESMQKLFNDDEIGCQIKEKLQPIRGHYSFILESQAYVLVVVDRIRSFPIFYSENDGLSISGSANDIKGKFSANNVDQKALLEFEMAGYVSGRKTLQEEVYQMLPGEYLIYDKKTKNIYRDQYYQYGLDSDYESKKTEEELLQELHLLHIKIFSEMIESLDGRPVWIPLSGGLDSRFILAMLKELNYENVTTFSYGPHNFWEIQKAEKIASFLHVKWHHVEYDPKEIRDIFDKEDQKKYHEEAWGKNSVPVLNDYYAILMLRERGVLPDDAIFINGQSGDFLTGGHIPHLESNMYDISFLIEKIVSKHYSLWEQLKTKDNLKYITGIILSEIKLCSGAHICSKDVAKYYEFYEWKERQCKFVINGQRVYEHFGFDWKLPLWHDELMFFWEKVPWEKKYKQKLFKKYLSVYDPATVFNKDWNVAQYNYRHIPFILRVLTSVMRTVFPNYNFQQNFTEYYSTYAAFYPQKNYFDFIRNSKGHRNSVSFHAKLIAKDLK